MKVKPTTEGYNSFFCWLLFFYIKIMKGGNPLSISIRNGSGTLDRVAGFSDVDAILSPTSANPIQNKAVYNALAQKIEKTVTDLVNYYDTSQVYNKTEVRELIGAINTLTIEVVATLPTQDISATTIYFVGPATGTNTYDEYVYVGNNWVKIGDTDIDLSNYIMSAQLTTALQSYYTSAAVDALLSANYYTKSEVDTELNAKQNTLTFDTTPTAGSSNPVTSTGIKAAIDANDASVTKNEVDDLFNLYVSKNLLPNEGVNTYSANGVTFTKLADGRVKVNGTASAYTLYNLFPYGGVIENKNGLIVSALGNSIVLRVKDTDDNWYGSSTTEKIVPAGKNITAGSIAVGQGVTANNVIVGPMLRAASIADNTYVPYNFTETIELTKGQSGSTLGLNISQKRGNIVEFNFNISNGTFAANTWTTLATFDSKYAPDYVYQNVGILDDNSGNGMIIGLIRVTTDGRIQVRPNDGTKICTRVSIVYTI